MGSYGGFREHCPGKVQGVVMCLPLVMRVLVPAQAHGSYGGFREHCPGKVQGSYVFPPSHACACASPNSWEFGCFFVTKFTFTSTMRNPNRDGGMSPGKRPGPIGPPGAL